MMKDVGLLGERVRKLQTHFGQANERHRHILTSTGKIEKRGDKHRGPRIRRATAPASAEVIAAPMTRKLGTGE